MIGNDCCKIVADWSVQAPALSLTQLQKPLLERTPLLSADGSLLVSPNIELAGRPNPRTPLRTTTLGRRSTFLRL